MKRLLTALAAVLLLATPTYAVCPATVTIATCADLIDHGAVTGLTDDDHTQYALLAGRDGGQTIIGSTESGEDIVIQSTSHATKGQVYFGAAKTTYFDEANNKVVIGNNLEIAGIIRGGYTSGGQNAGAAFQASVGVGTNTFGTSATKTLALGNGTVPADSIANGVQLYAEDVTASSELRVRDEAGNVTTLSPHNFTLFSPDPSYGAPFSYYSKNPFTGKEVNVDMYGAIKAVEALTGKKFIYEKDLPPEARSDWGEAQEAIRTERQARISEQLVRKAAWKSKHEDKPFKEEALKPYKKKQMPKWMRDRIQ